MYLQSRYQHIKYISSIKLTLMTKEYVQLNELELSFHVIM